MEASLATIREGYVRTIDLGRIRYRDHEGRTCTRYFHNIASFGLGGEVVDRVNRTSKACGPFITFIWGTLVSLFAYGKKRIRLRVDDGDERTVDVLNIAVANGRYHGGGMLVAPDAVTDDGLFHVTVIGAMSLPLVFWHLPKLYTGGIKRIRQVSIATGKRVIAASEQRVLLDIDGEQPGTLPAELSIVPGAINMIMNRPPDRRPSSPLVPLRRIVKIPQHRGADLSILTYAEGSPAEGIFRQRFHAGEYLADLHTCDFDRHQYADALCRLRRSMSIGAYSAVA